jgi:hypothetical protein
MLLKGRVRMGAQLGGQGGMLIDWNAAGAPGNRFRGHRPGLPLPLQIAIDGRERDAECLGRLSLGDSARQGREQMGTQIEGVGTHSKHLLPAIFSLTQAFCKTL